MTQRRETRRATRQRGASAIAYGLIIGLISVLSIGSVGRLGTDITSLFDGVSADLTGGAVCQAATAPRPDGGTYSHRALVHRESVAITVTAPAPGDGGLPGASAFREDVTIRCSDGDAFASAPFAVATACQAPYELRDGACSLPANTPPIAAHDAITTDEDSPFIGSVFADNGSGVDRDPDGQTLTVSAVDGQSANVGTELTLTSGALLTISRDGAITYDPNDRFEALTPADSATESLTYTLSDGAGGSAQAVVTVTLAGVNDAPAFDGPAIASITGGAGEALTPVLDVSARFSDVDGSCASFAFSPANPGGLSISDAGVITGPFGSSATSATEVRVICTDQQGASANSNAFDVTVASPCTAAAETFDHTGSVQRLTVPSGCTRMTVEVFGAGGGGHAQASGEGGNGGYALGTFGDLVAGADLSVIVGGGGICTNTTSGTLGAFGGGGVPKHPSVCTGGSTGSNLPACGGGGYSGVIALDPDVIDLSAASGRESARQNALIIAGGGGGSVGDTTQNRSGAPFFDGGHGGGEAGLAALNSSGVADTSGGGGQPGTQSAGGTGGTATSFCPASDITGGLAGSALKGGDGGHRGQEGAGGGGYYGGGASPLEGTPDWGGAGGSGHCAASASECFTVVGFDQLQDLSGNAIATPAGIRLGGAAVGTNAGSPGRVVVSWGE